MSDLKRADEAIRMTVGAGDGAVGFFLCLFGYGSGFGPYSIKNDSPNKRIVFTVLFVRFSMGLPDVYFGFRAVFQPNDIFAVGVEQQNGRDE